MPNRDYPNKARLNRDLDTEIRLILDRHYALEDKHAATLARVQALEAQLARVQNTPSPNGATNSRILGIPVAPADLQALADGAKLTWVKAKGTFVFQ